MNPNQSIKILYVDDEEVNLFLFEITFKSVFTVTTAMSGLDALVLLEKQADFDLVISDMHMPIMNGLEFLSKAKEIKKEIPCIILSGYEKTKVMEDAIRTGMIKEYLSKPYDKDQLEQLVLSLVKV